MATPGAPRFSIVTAVYDVERYLPEFIASVEGQTFDLDQVEVVVVDDGSTDGSLQLLQDWERRRPATVRVLSQENAGQGAARNLGLAAARGEWVTFPDPDDALTENYLQTVHDFLEQHPTTDMVAVNRWLWDEATGEIKNRHPLESFFRYDRLLDMEESDGRFHGSSPAAFFRLSVLREHGLEHDTRIRPNFEDGHFCSLYLLQQQAPQVGFVVSARYLYRKRADGSSSLGSSMSHPGRYTDVFTYGYQAVLDEAEKLRGEIPRWLQHFVCYELANYFKAAQSPSVASITEGPVAEAFHENVAAVLRRIDPASLLATEELPIGELTRLVLIHGYSDAPWRDDAVLLDRLDTDQRLVRARYRFTGPAPSEEVFNGDAPSSPRHAKTREISFFGRVLMHERVMWVRYRPDVRFRIDGAWAPVVLQQRETPPPTRATPVMLRNVLLKNKRRHFDPERHTPKSRKDRMVKRLAATPVARKRFDDAWVFLDRVHDAGDSGEILFKHVRARHPSINAWFVVTKDSPDHARLRSEGHSDRLIAHGSVQWRLLMANCSHVLSSHADAPIIAPPEIRAFMEPRWHFTFLQHGVIKDDLSRWLNPKKIDLFVVSTVAELASIAGDHTAYTYTTKETVLTGLPRFDRLAAVADRTPPDRRDLVLLTPTWREWLVHTLAAGSQKRDLRTDVLESDFVRSWMALLNDPRLQQACAEAGMQLAFLPHPNLHALLDQLEVPAHVLTLSYAGNDVQEYFARANVLVTDYSSIAFNAAYLDRPVVYFQFDRDDVLSGGHVGHKGYFEYDRDGFGPVSLDLEAAVEATLDAVSRRGAPAPEYACRIQETFPQRDGGACERVVQAVLASTRRDRSEGTVPPPVGPR